MNWDLVIGFGSLVLFMGAPAILIASFFRQNKSESQPVVEMKINTTETVWSLLLFSLMCFGAWGAVFFAGQSWHYILFFSPLLVLCSIDWLILVSHLFNYMKRKIIWEKKSGLLRIKESRRDFEICLNAQSTSIIKYHPSVKDISRRFPGDGFEVLYISDGTHSVKISNLEYEDYGMDEVLEHHPNYKLKKRQFNFLFW